jgi:hypothetical protein
LTNHPNKKADQDNPTGLFDLAAWKKKVLDDPESRAVIEDFLKHRHREGEYLGEDAKLKDGVINPISVEIQRLRMSIFSSSLILIGF